KHHKDVFNRKNQLFSAQKSNPSLILARKEPPFIYPFSDFIQDYARPSFYISILKNCIYDCKYCYLQQNDSANLLYFVNNDEFINEASKLPKNARISISYDTDLLALDSLLNSIGHWIEFAKTSPDKLIELRTKSTNIGMLLNQDIPPNFQIAYTLLPEQIQQTYEKNTPKLKSRLNAIQKLQSKGINIMICIDPIIAHKEYDKLYLPFVDKLREHIDAQNLSFSIGVFRLNLGTLKNITKKEIKSDLLYLPYEKIEDEATYSRDVTKSLLEGLEKKIKDNFANTEVYKPQFKKGA
ncbi:MAG: radical SAM protein, partial [Campylobacterales bacterium]